MSFLDWTFRKKTTYTTRWISSDH